MLAGVLATRLRLAPVLMFFFAVPHVVLCCAVLCCAVLCCALRCAALRCAALWCGADKCHAPDGALTRLVVVVVVVVVLAGRFAQGRQSGVGLACVLRRVVCFAVVARCLPRSSPPCCGVFLVFLFGCRFPFTARPVLLSLTPSCLPLHPSTVGSRFRCSPSWSLSRGPGDGRYGGTPCTWRRATWRSPADLEPTRSCGGRSTPSRDRAWCVRFSPMFACSMLDVGFSETPFRLVFGLVFSLCSCSLSAAHAQKFVGTIGGYVGS